MKSTEGQRNVRGSEMGTRCDAHDATSRLTAASAWSARIDCQSISSKVSGSSGYRPVSRPRLSAYFVSGRAVTTRFIHSALFVCVTWSAAVFAPRTHPENCIRTRLSARSVSRIDTHATPRAARDFEPFLLCAPSRARGEIFIPRIERLIKQS